MGASLQWVIEALFMCYRAEGIIVYTLVHINAGCEEYCFKSNWELNVLEAKCHLTFQWCFFNSSGNWLDMTRMLLHLALEISRHDTLSIRITPLVVSISNHHCILGLGCHIIIIVHMAPQSDSMSSASRIVLVNRWMLKDTLCLMHFFVICNGILKRSLKTPSKLSHIMQAMNHQQLTKQTWICSILLLWSVLLYIQIGFMSMEILSPTSF